jgi:hypothetical protein
MQLGEIIRVFSEEAPANEVLLACNDIVLLGRLPHADGVRMVGNLLGDPTQEVVIGTEVEGVFEHHRDSDPPYSLLQWRML